MWIYKDNKTNKDDKSGNINYFIYYLVFNYFISLWRLECGMYNENI